MIRLDWLDRVSRRTYLGRSLSNKRVKDIDLNALFHNDILPYINKLNTIMSGYQGYNRVKSAGSCYRKAFRYIQTSRSVRDVFNDILGIRFIVKDYNEIIQFPEVGKVTKVVHDGTKNGYCGVHYYYQKSNQHYKIEVQINTYSDRLFADWCHKYVYKLLKNENYLGLKLRELFDKGLINSEEDFVLCLTKLLS